MTFTWPWALLALLLVPLVFGIGWWARRRRRRAAVRVTSIAVVRAALPGRTRWTRLVPTALLVLGLVVLGVGGARPQATVPVPDSSTTIMLALDVSGSMCATDVSPNRITVAEDAAISFIKAEAGAKIGLVAFAGVAGLQVPPTTDSGRLIDAIQQLTTARGTAIGAAILTAIDGIAAEDPSVAPTGVDLTTAASAYAPDVIVLLTDGANTQGVTPADAATQAAARGIRVYTIGFGTTNPTALACSSAQAGGFGGPPGGFGGRGFGAGGGYGGGRENGRSPLIIDEQALQDVAATTGGQYYRAESADALTGALGDLPHHVTVVRKKIDLSSWFAGGGLLLVVAAVALSLWWGRPRRAVPASRRPDPFVQDSPTGPATPRRMQG